MGFLWFYVYSIQLANVAETTVTVQMDERGRVVIPKAARKKLGIDGRSATIELVVRDE